MTNRADALHQAVKDNLPPLPAFTLADLNDDPTAPLIRQAQFCPLEPGETRRDMVASALAYARHQPERIAAEIEALKRRHDQWVEAVDTLERIHARTEKP